MSNDAIKALLIGIFATSLTFNYIQYSITLGATQAYEEKATELLICEISLDRLNVEMEVIRGIYGDYE